MHGQFLPLGASSARLAEILLSCIAGCAGVSGRGYYATGPVLDVPGRPRQGKAVLVRPAGMSEMPNDGLCTGIKVL